jgi:hypothetical protein
MELVRELLLEIEADPQFNGRQTAELPVGNRDPEVMAYTLALLISAGIVAGQVGIVMPRISGLTWDGHDLLDNIRDPGVWEKVKEHAKTIASVSIPILAELAKAEVKKRLGLP